MIKNRIKVNINVPYWSNMKTNSNLVESLTGYKLKRKEFDRNI